ncbi:6-phosphogluconolactonase [Marinibactrum halimedae]|nr:6-phosphogluconolactonase [Marinibactrum halimedae]MCD9460945.1 6-phosphogluconolactonase [Marinibactrum halimedae]
MTETTHYTVTKAATKAEQEAQLVDFVRQAVERAIESRGFATLVVSGGSTPKGLFQALSGTDLDWSKVYITLADERCVPETDDLSNAKLVKDNLCQSHAAVANFVPLFLEDESEEACRARFAEHPQLSETYDVVFLGMGGDAHTASIFPEAAERDMALDMTSSVNILKTDPVTVAPLRLTQTRPRLLDTHNLLLQLIGEDKWDVFSGVAEANTPDKPITQFIHQITIPLQVYFAEKK